MKSKKPPHNIAGFAVPSPLASAPTGDRIIIALDAMGGDNAPAVVVEGALSAAKRFPELDFRLFGDEAAIHALLANHPDVMERITVIHTDEKVAPDDKPSSALRRGTKTSMRMAINDVLDGNSHAIISAGNTGALMAISKFVLRTLPGVDRPAISAIMPSQKGPLVMLDMGANLECTAENLFQFAVMGAAFYRAALGSAQARVGILNIGHEEAKGHGYLRDAAEMIRQSGLKEHYHGFVEGNDLSTGTVQVVVTDGFTGNVALKVAEGVAKFVSGELKRELKGGLLSRLGALLSLPALRRVRRRFNPSLYNGGMLVGLNGIVIKSHGSADAEGFANAIGVARGAVAGGINAQITAELESFHQHNAPLLERAAQ
jgi:glycerol-3-phosphate acyltransferase PlsX